MDAKTSFKTDTFYDINILPEQIEVINQTYYQQGFFFLGHGTKVMAPMVDSGKSAQK